MSSPLTIIISPPHAYGTIVVSIPLHALLKMGRYYNTTVSLLGNVSKIVSLPLSKLASVPILTYGCVTVTIHF